MSGDRIDDYIQKAEEHDSVCQDGKDSTLVNQPILRQNTPEGRRKLLESLLDFTSTVTTATGNNKIPVSVYMREEANPTRAPLEPGSVLSEGCATLAEEYYKYCPHDRAGLAGKRLFCKILKRSLSNFSSLIDLCENEINKGDAVGAIRELRKADQEDLVSEELYGAAEAAFKRNWNAKSKLPAWTTVFNGSVRKMGDLAPKLPEECAPTEAKVRARFFDSLKLCKDQDFRTELAVLKADKSLTLAEIQGKLAAVDPNAKSKPQTNHEIHDGNNASVSSAVTDSSVDQWGETVRLSPSGAVLGVYYPPRLSKHLPDAQKKDVDNFFDERRQAGVTSHLPYIGNREEDFCKKLFSELKAAQQAAQKESSGGRGGGGGGKGGRGGGKGGGGGKGDGKRDRDSDANEPAGKRIKALIASVDSMKSKLKRQEKKIAELTKRNNEAQVGAAEAMSPATKKEQDSDKKKGVRFATPEGTASIKGAIGSVQRIQKQKQDVEAVSDPAS